MCSGWKRVATRVQTTRQQQHVLDGLSILHNLEHRANSVAVVLLTLFDNLFVGALPVMSISGGQHTSIHSSHTEGAVAIGAAHSTRQIDCTRDGQGVVALCPYAPAIGFEGLNHPLLMSDGRGLGFCDICHLVCVTNDPHRHVARVPECKETVYKRSC